MRTTSDYIKTYLEFSRRVLGISQIYESSNKDLVSAPDADKKKIFNFYFWPQVKFTSFSKELFVSHSIRTIFVFFSDQNDFESQLKRHSEMVAKMNQALGGDPQELLVGWITPNVEREFFSVISQWANPLRIIFFRQQSMIQETIIESGPHRILETLSPLTDVNDTNRKRMIWNDFKRLMAFT